MATRLIIEGTVQGVGYRYALTRQATALGLDGWVCNRADGTVEAWARGAQHDIDALVAWARQGPPGARVTGVHVAPADDAEAGGPGFRIAATR